MNRNSKYLFLCAVLIAAMLNTVQAKLPNGRAKKQGGLAKADKVAVANQFTLTGNNWAIEMTNNGSYANDPAGRIQGGGSGGEFPRGTGTYIVYAAGLQVGALVNGVPKVSVIDFDSEFQPGALIKNNAYDKNEVPVATNPGLDINKLFVLTKDGSDGTPLGSNGDAVDDYVKWPKEYGAPVKADGSPLVIGDMMSWCVYNDMDVNRHKIPDDTQKDPLGLEVQQTSMQVNITGYSDVVFMHWKIINKGTTDLTNVYTSGWFDADVDKASNDLVATDTVANMVYVYNGDDTDPVSAGGSAFGADFFQGPVVPGLATDTARYLEMTTEGFVQRVIPGKKVLGLSATVRYINVLGAEGDPDNDGELYNLMQGKEKNGDLKSSRFAYPSNPLIDPPSKLDPSANDKRILLSTGPFNLAVGDTQVIVLACVGGKGTNRLNAVENLLATDVIAQQAYDAKFLLPQPPLSPKLSATSLSNKVALQWDNSPEFFEDKYPQLAGLSIPNYTTRDFAGYKVYRSLSGTVGSWSLIAQFDKKDGITEIPDTTWLVQDQFIKTIKNISIGDDKGLKYSFSDENVVNGQTYYYAVTSYDAQPNIRSGAAPVTLESTQSENAVRITPQPQTLGNQINATAQDTATHTGPSAGFVTINVVDPKAVTGHSYKVVFENVQVVNLSSHDTTTQLMWKLFDINKNAFVKFFRADDPNTNINESFYQINQITASDPSVADAFATVDGVQIRVYGPLPDYKDFLVPQNGGGVLDPPSYAAYAFNSSGFPNSGNYPDEDRPAANQQISGALWGIHTGYTGNNANASFAYFKSRTLRSGANDAVFAGNDFEIRFTATGGLAYDAYGNDVIMSVPFEVWNIGKDPGTADDFRMIPLLLDFNSNGVFDLDGQDHSISGGDNDPETDWIYLNNPVNTAPGSTGYNAFASKVASGDTAGAKNEVDTEVIARLTLVGLNLGSVSDSTFPNNIAAAKRIPETGTVFRIVSTKPNDISDEFTFTTSANTPFNAALAKSKLNKNYIKVVPNPYYGFSAYDQNQFNRRVKFTGLPNQCTIRIFNVAGDLIRTINHTGTSNNERSSSGSEFTSVEVWDLTSDNGIFVSSGMYFLYIDAPGIGKSDELIPFAIIQGSVQLTVPTN